MEESATNTMSKQRLVIFGCSHSVGEYLPDWDSETDYSHHAHVQYNSTFKYSKFNWANILAEKLDRTVVNLAKGGNSNHEIMLDILNFDFKATDLAVICWTHSDREIIFDPEIPGGKYKTITILINQNDQQYRFYQAHDIRDLEIRSREYIHHAELYLTNKKVKYCMARVEHWQHNVQWKYNNYDYFPIFDFIDRAADGFHPGIQSHQQFADKLYKEITMPITVVIPTAGLGSRMGNYTRDLNKALLPYKDQPVLAHIIDSFPRDTRFIIPVGYLAVQIKEFCSQAYSDRNITFVDIEDYTSENSGTGLTLLQCSSIIRSPFWYVPCDTYFAEQLDLNLSENTYFTKSVGSKDTQLYTIFEVDTNNRIQNVVFKQHFDSEQLAFTGLMYIHNWADFFYKLSDSKSNEFIGIIESNSNTRSLNSWLDFGCPTIYQTELSKSRTFDFTKKDELTYICNNRVVKWWLDPRIAEKKYNKVQANLSVFPNNCTFNGNFMAYDYFQGQTLYEFNNVIQFDRLLAWLESNVWKLEVQDISSSCNEFYKTKSLQRIDKFLALNPQLPDIEFVDNIPIKHYSYYLNNIDWQYLAVNSRPGFMHGDLQFDNIIIDNNYNFKLIDWRHEFADQITIGDIYYDLAKMMGGLIINYARIKRHNFDCQLLDNSVTLSIPSIDNIDIYKEKLESFILKHNLDLNKVRQLVPIIFWNMSPLHSSPFDLFLWYLGLKLFAELEQ